MPTPLNLQFQCTAPNNKCQYPNTSCITPDDEGLPRTCPYLEAKQTTYKQQIDLINKTLNYFILQARKRNIDFIFTTPINKIQNPCDTCRLKNTHLCTPQTCPTKLTIKAKTK